MKQNMKRSLSLLLALTMALTLLLPTAWAETGETVTVNFEFDYRSIATDEMMAACEIDCPTAQTVAVPKGSTIYDALEKITESETLRLCAIVLGRSMTLYFNMLVGCIPEIMFREMASKMRSWRKMIRLHSAIRYIMAQSWQRNG